MTSPSQSLSMRALTVIDMVAAANAVAPFSWSNGLKFDATSRLVVTTTNPVVSWNNGLPFDADGNLCVTLA